MKSKSRVVLKLLNESNLEFAREIRNKYNDSFYTQDTITKEQQRAWYQKYVANYGHDYFWIIELHDGTKIGTICLYNIDFGHRQAQIGRMVLEVEYRGQGYMEEAIRTVLDMAFNHMRLHKVCLDTHIDNSAAISLYHKCGFRSITRPVLLMEAVNPDADSRKPMGMYDLSEIKGVPIQEEEID